MSGQEIAVEVAAALAEVAQEVGDVAFPCVLRKRVKSGDAWAPTISRPDYPANGVRTKQRITDRADSRVGMSRDVLLLDGTIEPPEKGDLIFVGVDEATLGTLTAEEESRASYEIDEMDVVSPAGVPLMYRIYLDQ